MKNLAELYGGEVFIVYWFGVCFPILYDLFFADSLFPSSGASTLFRSEQMADILSILVKM